MNVFCRFSKRCLKENKTRTVVTIIGIILSMSLFTAVIEGAYSGIKYIQNCEIEREGSWNGYLQHLTKEQLKELNEDKSVSKVTAWGEVGWSKIESQNDGKPYVRILSMNDVSSEMVAIHLIEGRLPENENELLLSEHAITNGGMGIKVGEAIELEVGQRMSNGCELDNNVPLSEEGEDIVDTKTKTYKIVGICERLSDCIEPICCPGYYAMTVSESTELYSVFFELKNPNSYFSYIEEQEYSSSYGTHSELLAFYGNTEYNRINSVIYGFAIILIFLIMFGSISLIYNSFAISIGERTKLYGILKSVGATRKQIRKSVLYEALVLSAIGIPLGLIAGCVGIGTTLWCLRDAFKGFYSSYGGTEMKLVLSPAALAIAVAVCLITTLISAWIPAGKAMRVSPIDAVRQTQDIRINPRSVKTLAIVKKIFGFEGMLASKNFKRNKKRYRSVVISLFISVTLFISASSFCAYLGKFIGAVGAKDEGVDISYFYSVEDAEKIAPDDLLMNFMQLKGTKEASYCAEQFSSIHFPEENLDKSYRDIFQPYMSGGEVVTGLRVVFLQDEAFYGLCKRNKLDAEEYFNDTQPKALLVNEIDTNYRDENDENMLGRVKLIKDDCIPGVMEDVQYKQIEGYEIYGDWFQKDGESYYNYYEVDYLEKLYAGSEPVDDVIDESKAMLVPVSEAEIRTPFYIGAEVTDVVIGIDKRANNIIYPISMMDKVLEDTSEIYGYNFSFLVENTNSSMDLYSAMLIATGLNTGNLVDEASNYESIRMMILVVDVFSYGFIILISLIALANVFNTVSTNITLRRREFAMLRSIGLSDKGFKRTMNYECIIYGIKGLLWGLPGALVMTYWIYQVSGAGYRTDFFIPWYSVAIAVCSVFVVVFATMFYSTQKIKADNVIDALKNENM